MRNMLQYPHVHNFVTTTSRQISCLCNISVVIVRDIVAFLSRSFMNNIKLHSTRIAHLLFVANFLTLSITPQLIAQGSAEPESHHITLAIQNNDIAAYKKALEHVQDEEILKDALCAALYSLNENILAAFMQAPAMQKSNMQQAMLAYLTQHHKACAVQQLIAHGIKPENPFILAINAARTNPPAVQIMCEHMSKLEKQELFSVANCACCGFPASASPFEAAVRETGCGPFICSPEHATMIDKLPKQQNRPVMCSCCMPEEHSNTHCCSFVVPSEIVHTIGLWLAAIYSNEAERNDARWEPSFLSLLS